MSDNLSEQLLEEAFSSQSGTGEEELLRIASDFSVQLETAQFRTLLLLNTLADNCPVGAEYDRARRTLINIPLQYLKFKKFHKSNMFVLKALEMISIRKLLNENSLKVNVQKQ